MSVRRWLAAALLVPLALASACTGDDPVPKMPTPTTSEPTSEPTETETPEAETAEEFIRRWQVAVDEMQATGEVETFQSFNSRCTPCDDFADQVEGIYLGGGTIQSRGSVVTGVIPVSAAGDAFDATVKTTRSEVTGENAAVYPGAVQVFRIRLDRKGAEFKVADYKVLAR